MNKNDQNENQLQMIKIETNFKYLKKKAKIMANYFQIHESLIVSFSVRLCWQKTNDSAHSKLDFT